MMFLAQFATFLPAAHLHARGGFSRVPLLNRRAFGSAGSVSFWGRACAFSALPAHAMDPIYADDVYA